MNTKTVEKTKIYIIGEIDHKNLAQSSSKFVRAQKFLRKKGFEPINPFDVLLFGKVPREEFRRISLGILITCDAVFLLPCAVLNKSNIELKLAIDLKMSVFHTC